MYVHCGRIPWHVFWKMKRQQRPKRRRSLPVPSSLPTEPAVESLVTDDFENKFCACGPSDKMDIAPMGHGTGYHSRIVSVSFRIGGRRVVFGSQAGVLVQLEAASACEDAIFRHR